MIDAGIKGPEQLRPTAPAASGYAGMMSLMLAELHGKSSPLTAMVLVTWARQSTLRLRAAA
jgi:hypothetical protein